jgi:SPP1 family predicted phage head-tail adaptor
MIRRRLRDAVTIQEATISRSASGQPLESWGDVDTVRANIQAVSGKEFFNMVDAKSGGKRVSSVTTKIIIRYRDDVVPSMRVVHGSTVYDIIAVLGDDPRKPLQLMCERDQ